MAAGGWATLPAPGCSTPWPPWGITRTTAPEHALALSVIGFDDIESAAFLDLSTVRQPLALSGAEGARRLCALLRGERVRPRRQELPIELMARGSSAEPRPSALGPHARGSRTKSPWPGTLTIMPSPFRISRARAATRCET